MKISAIFLFKVRGLPYRLAKGFLFRDCDEALTWKVELVGSYLHYFRKSRECSAGEIQQKIRRYHPEPTLLIEVNQKTHAHSIYVKFEPHHLNMFTYWS